MTTKSRISVREDSFIAFEEVLQHAIENDVDAIILGGDLFHVANPSTNTLNRCTQMLKTYTLGNKSIKLEFLSDQNERFLESLNRTVNYEDPNMNIAIPVFSIHDNHDDPGICCVYCKNRTPENIWNKQHCSGLCWDSGKTIQSTEGL